MCVLVMPGIHLRHNASMLSVASGMENVASVPTASISATGALQHAVALANHQFVGGKTLKEYLRNIMFATDGEANFLLATHQNFSRRNSMTFLFKNVRGAAYLGATAVLCASSVAFSQSYPVRPIRLVVPFSAGGVNDIIARIIAQRSQQGLGQPMIVDNRAGAGGNIGTDIVAKSAADGYTLLSGGMGSLVLNPIVSKVPYDTARDFAPIILAATSPHVLVVHPALPVHDVKSLVALAIRQPGKVSYSSGGIGSTPHLAVALLASMTGSNFVHIPYKGTAPAITDLVAGQTQFAFLGIPAAYSHIKSDRLRAIAVSSATQSPALPGVPTVAASGILGYEMSPWFGVLAPARTPRDIVGKLNTVIAAALRDAATQGKLQVAGADLLTSTPEEFAGRIKSDLATWAKVIKQAGIKGE